MDLVNIYLNNINRIIKFFWGFLKSNGNVYIDKVLYYFLLCKLDVGDFWGWVNFFVVIVFYLVLKWKWLLVFVYKYFFWLSKNGSIKIYVILNVGFYEWCRNLC